VWVRIRAKKGCRAARDQLWGDFGVEVPSCQGSWGADGVRALRFSGVFWQGFSEGAVLAEKRGFFEKLKLINYFCSGRVWV